MSETKLTDGGPAFPRFGMNAWDKPQTIDAGMSLRDWIAGQVAAAAIVNATGITEDVADEAFPIVARISYKLADAMLAARSEKDG